MSYSILFVVDLILIKIVMLIITILVTRHLLKQKTLKTNEHNKTTKLIVNQVAKETR